MPSLFSLSIESSSNIFSFLDDKTLYSCLFVDRYLCTLSIPKLWRDPFKYSCQDNCSSIKVINTLLTCFNEEEISSLAPYTINFNNHTPLFEYGKFVTKIHHENCAENVAQWLEESQAYQDYEVQKFVDAIYHMIMRQGSNLQEFDLTAFFDNYIGLPKISTFTTYKPGITNLRSLKIFAEMIEQKNAIEFFSMVPKFCDGIVDFNLWFSKYGKIFEPFLDIIKLQPLERVFINSRNRYEAIQKIIYSLEFRSETLKELKFEDLYFKNIDLSFMLKFKCLENLAFIYCKDFVSQHYDILLKLKLQLKKLTLFYDDNIEAMINSFINSLCSKTLLKLSSNIITPETVKACPNISFLHIEFLEQPLDSIIPLICELPSLKILYIQVRKHIPIDKDLIVKLGDYLTFVEYLSLNFFVDLSSFEYFTSNCKANLKKWNIILDKNPFRKDYLLCVNNYQRVHNSLKVLGISNMDYTCGFNWTIEESEIINSLKNQNVDIIPSTELNILFEI